MEKQNPEEEASGGAPPPCEESESTCSTPYASAPSSPGRSNTAGFFFSAPTSPIHHVLSSPLAAASAASPDSPGSFEFEFSSRLADAAPADELFLNGRIRPMRLPFPSPTPQVVNPPRGRDLRFRSGSVHRRARSLSPMRHGWADEDEEAKTAPEAEEEAKEPCISASSSRSSSSSSSKKWTFLKGLLLPRSKSEGSGNDRRERFWHNLTFSSSSSSTSSFRDRPVKDLKSQRKPRQAAAGKRRPASAHERHYAEKRAEAEEMRRRTFLPYRQGLLLGCLGLSSRGYGAMTGIAARTLHTVSSR